MKRILCFSLLLSVWSAHAADWPRWRGPANDGVVPGKQFIAEKLPAEAKVVWKLRIGEGLASPVVADGKVIYFDAVDGKETLHVIDAVTTNELWRAVIDDTFRDGQGPAAPRCTPLVDQGRVYALSCKGELKCLELKSGKQVWRVNFTNDLGAVFIGEKGNAPGAMRHGNNGTPLIVGNRLYAQVGGTNGNGVVCFDKKTGKVIWRSQNDQAGYAPIVRAKMAGVWQLLCFTVDGFIGLQETDGKLLWRVPIKTAFARHVTTPVVFEDTAVVSSHQVGMVAVKVSKQGGVVKGEQAWLKKDTAMNFSSPVAVGKYMYGLGPVKNLECIEITTGNVAWSQNGYIATSADRAYATFMVLGKNILMLNDTGELVLFAADPTGFKLISQLQVCGVNWCNPAYVDGRLYVRDGNKLAGDLYCIDLR